MLTTINTFNKLVSKKNYEHRLSKRIRSLGNRVVIVTAPPGAGKTSCINGVLLMNVYLNKILEKYNLPHLKLIYTPGSTTRPLRKNELHGYDFNFLSNRQFFTQLKNKELLLYFISYPYLYAVSGEKLERRLKDSDEYTILVYNLNAFQVKKLQKQFTKKPKVIFIMAPSWQELERRKFRRGGLSPQETKFRRETAKKEAKQGRKISNFRVTNKYFPQTIQAMMAFIFSKMIGANAKISQKHQKKINLEIKKITRKNKKELLAILKNN